MKPMEIANGIYEVGVYDWNIRDFHGYSTYLGTTYNAYLIVDEKVVLVDTVKKEFTDQLLEHISRIIDPRRIDFVVSNHTEMDHSGGLPRVMHRIGEEKPIYCSPMGHKNLSAHFPRKYDYRSVVSGDKLAIGRRTLTFLETRMLHWPDSMFTYVPEEGILFSSDAFGQHYAGYEDFDDQVGDAIMPHARKYFANILLPYAPLITKLLDQVAGMGLDIRMICPDHGILWRKDPGKIIDAYGRWARQETQKKAVVIYDTMWHSTEHMAEAIAEGITECGVDARPMHLRRWHRSDVMTEVLDAKAVILGSPTLNNGLFPTVADFLSYLKGLRPQKRLAAAFGSYGWSGEAVRILTAELEAAKFEMVDPGLKLQFVPDGSSLETCREFGRKIGKAVAP